MDADYSYLCGNCGKVSRHSEWEALSWNPEGEGYVPHPEGQEDPLLRCPRCGFVHTDDDGNPGIWDGLPLELARIRREDDYFKDWDGPIYSREEIGGCQG